MNMNTEGQGGYVYQSTKKKGAGYLNTYDLQMLNQMVESSSQPGNILSLGSSHVIADQSRL